MKKIGIVGVSGFGGGELLRLVAGHPTFEIAYVAGESTAGKPLSASGSMRTSSPGILITLGARRLNLSKLTGNVFTVFTARSNDYADILVRK